MSRNPRESSVEVAAIKLWLKLGAVAVRKDGREGWPDRLVLMGNGRHFWAELKTQTGQLRASQVEIKRQLEIGGDLVFVVRSVEDAQVAWDLAQIHFESEEGLV